MNTDWVSMKPTGPFNLAKTIECGQMFRWQRLQHADIGEHYEIVIYGNVVHVGQVDSEIVFSSAPVPSKDFRPRLEHCLALDHDLEQIYSALGSDPDGVMPCLIDRHHGLRIMRQEPWECLASFICTTNVDISTTRRLVEGMARRFGNEIQIGGPSRHSFPLPEVLAGVGHGPLEELFRELGARFPTKFANRVAKAAVTVDKGKINTELGEFRFILSELHRLRYDMAFALLSNVEGVGSKIGDCVLLFSFDKHQAFPVDTHVEQALRRWYLGDADIEAFPRTLRERFGPHAGYASQYLFYDERKLRDPSLP